MFGCEWIMEKYRSRLIEGREGSIRDLAISMFVAQDEYISKEDARKALLWCEEHYEER